MKTLEQGPVFCTQQKYLSVVVPPNGRTLHYQHALGYIVQSPQKCKKERLDHTRSCSSMALPHGARTIGGSLALMPTVLNFCPELRSHPTFSLAVVKSVSVLSIYTFAFWSRSGGVLGTWADRRS